MFSSLRLRILLAALIAIVLALTVNGIASYTTVKHHNSEQVNRNLSAVVNGNTQAINEWFNARYTMLASMEHTAGSEEPLQALRQLADSGDFMTAYIAYPSTSEGIFSDGWQPPSDYDPRQRPWYQGAVNAQDTIITAPYVDAQTGGLIITFARPFYQNGELAAVVGADITIADVIDIVASISPTPSSFGFLTTNDGTLVAHPDESLTLEPSSVLSDALTPSDLTRIVQADSPQPLALQGSDKLLMGSAVGGNSGWQLVVALDEAEATAGLRAIATTSIVTLLIVAAITAVVEALEITPEELLASEDLGAILQYHVVAGQALSTDLSDGQMIETLLGPDVTVTITMDGVFINDAQVTVADLTADNGVVHVIDAVLLPPAPPTTTVVDVIVSSPDHELLEAAVGAAGLVDALSAEGPFTVFAPTDAAVTALVAGECESYRTIPYSMIISSMIIRR